jgi:glycerophosphoryl diester phosphodiesterase
MIIISHRGYWKSADEKNRPIAFRRSFDLGFGTETDVRDRNGALVISHEMADTDAMTLDDLLDLLDSRKLPLAINIKADGLARSLQQQMAARGLSGWFTFDMTVPELVVQLRLGLPAYTRASEYEQPPPCYDRAIGVWLDSFAGQWYSPSIIEQFLRDGKRVSIVSPELHGREHLSLWSSLKQSRLVAHPDLMLCTDLPEDAVTFLEGSP